MFPGAVPPCCHSLRREDGWKTSQIVKILQCPSDGGSLPKMSQPQFPLMLPEGIMLWEEVGLRREYLFQRVE